MKRAFWYCSAVLVIGAVLIWWRLKPVTPVRPGAGDRITVVASFYPLSYFVQEIGGDHIIVTNLTPAGAEPHDFEPTPRDLAAIERSHLLLLNGIGLEPWATSVITNLRNSPVVVLEAAAGLNTSTDPHVWLDPILAQAEVAKITQALVNIDPDHQVKYEQNSTALSARLSALDQAFRTGLASCRQKNIVTSHAAFGYLADRYGLKQITLTGLSPDEEPTPRDLAIVADFVRQNKIDYIFLETLVSPRLAETLAREVGAQTLVFNPLEGLTPAEQQSGQDYFSIQKQNLANLKIALDCKE